jgi:hypothetical protein
MKNLRVIMLLVLSFALLVSVSTGYTASPPQGPEETLKKRVEGLMGARIQGNWAEVYDFYDSAFRETISREDFDNHPRNMLFKSFRIEEIEILPSGEEATVKVRMDFSARGYDFKDAPENQQWIKQEGQWFLKVRPRKNPFAPAKK